MKIENIIAGLQIIAKSASSRFCVVAEHDELYAGSVEDLQMPDDHKKLIELGWELVEGGRWKAYP